jgi:CcmD family protein
MLFLQDAPPNTTSYMIAGYAVIFIVLALYLASLAIRQRNLRRDAETLEQLERAGKKSPADKKISEAKLGEKTR